MSVESALGGSVVSFHVDVVGLGADSLRDETGGY